MFDFDAGKLIVFGIVALAVIPPKDLPRVMRTVGKYVGQMRRMAADFQGQFMDAMKEAELDTVKKEIAEINQASKLDTSFDPARLMRESVQSAVADKPAPSAYESVTVAEPAPMPVEIPSATSRPRRPRRTRHERRRHRGFPGASDRTPHRAAPAADPRALRLLRRLLRLLLFLAQHLQHLDLALCACGRRRAGQVDRHAFPGAVLHQHPAQHVRGDRHRLPGDRDADLPLRRARPLQERTPGVPALPDRDAGVLRRRARCSSISA